jgi:hypothetical protein
MTITVGTDTYATVAEADTYATGRAWTDWLALGTSVKEARLVEAASYLDTSYEWKGRITETDQPLSWPRDGVVDKEGRLLASDVVPARVKAAQIELARIATAGLVVSDTQGEVSQITAGSVSLTFKDSQSVTEGAKYRPIDRMLTGLYVARAGQMRNVRLING